MQVELEGICPEAAPEPSPFGEAEASSDARSELESLPRSRLVFKVILAVASWWLVSVLVTLQMKHLVGDGGMLPFAILVTGICNTSTGFFAWVITRAVPRLGPPVPPLEWREVGVIVLLGILQACEYAFSNKALETLSVSGRTMIGSASVLVLMLSSQAWGIEQLDGARLFAGLLVTAGAALQGLGADSYGDMGRSGLPVRGILLMLMAMLAGSQRWVLVQLVLHRAPPGSALAVMAKAKLQFVQRTLPVAGLVCLLIAVPSELPEVTTEHLLRGEVYLRLAAVGLGIVIITVSEYELVLVTSAVAMAVISALHGIPVAFFGALVFQEVLRPVCLAGFGLCIAGAICYSRARQRSPGEAECRLLQRSLSADLEDSRFELGGR